MPLLASAAATAATGRPRARLPATAERLRLPLYERSQSRLRERWGFDLNAADALARAQAVLGEAPADPDRLLLVAAVLASRGDDGGALAAAQAAVDADASSARAQTTLATLLGRAGDHEAAYRHAGRAAELDGADPIALYNRGLAALAVGDKAAARADFDRTSDVLGMRRLPWWSRWWHRP